jgi:thioredoxin-dependent peroxiredoxin
MDTRGGLSLRTRIRRSGIAAGALALLLGATFAMAAPLNVGDKAPDFTLPDQNGKPVKLSDFLGKKNVVLAFYVLAFTGG